MHFPDMRINIRRLLGFVVAIGTLEPGLLVALKRDVSLQKPLSGVTLPAIRTEVTLHQFFPLEDLDPLQTRVRWVREPRT